jgi:hypothetical protein
MTTHAERTSFADALYDECLNTMESKGHDYSGPGFDAYANFIRAEMSSRGTVDRKQVLMIYASKHWDAINTAVWQREELCAGERVRGRIIDLIVYLTFLAHMEEGG